MVHIMHVYTMYYSLIVSGLQLINCKIVDKMCMFNMFTCQQWRMSIVAESCLALTIWREMIRITAKCYSHMHKHKMNPCCCRLMQGYSRNT